MKLGVFLSHYKDPYEPTSISWNDIRVLKVAHFGIQLKNSTNLDHTFIVFLLFGTPKSPGKASGPMGSGKEIVTFDPLKEATINLQPVFFGGF